MHMLGPEDKFTVAAFDHEQLWWTGEDMIRIEGVDYVKRRGWGLQCTGRGL
jgi:hypothetical protein